MRMLVETYYGRMVSFVNGLSGRRDELQSLPWTLSEFPIELTYEEARAMANDVVAIVQRYRREPGHAPRDGAVRAIFQFQTLPDEDPADR